jgi:putative heme-binding domain-containing protein
LWVADMVRQTIEHPEWIPEAWQIKLDLYAGNQHGRIYRIFRNDTPPTQVPDFTRLTAAELVQELGATNGWRRDTAQQLLLERNDTSVVSALETMTAEDPRPLARLHALATLDGLEQLSVGLIIKAFSDHEPSVIAWAIVLAEAKLVSHTELVEHLLELADHDDLRVRFQLALTLGELSDHERNAEQTSRVLLQLALRDPNDPWIRAAVISSSRNYADRMLTELLQSLEHISLEQASSVGNLLQDLIATSLGEDIGQGTARIIRAIVRNSEIHKPGELQSWQFTALASCVSALQRRNMNWDSIAQDNAIIAAEAQPLFAAARRVTADENESLKRRLATIELLGCESTHRESDWALLTQLMSVQAPPLLQQAAVRVLAKGRPEDLAQRLLADWPSRGPQLRSQIIATLLTRGSWVQKLMQALSAGTLPTHDLSASSRWRLLGYPHPRVREQALRLFGENSASNRADILEAYASAASLTIDVNRGKLLFTKTCATCHQHAGVGKDLGPKLAALQDKSPEFLLTAILDPNRAIDQKYHAYTVVTQNGLALSGLITAETANSIELMDAQGKAHTILRIDIEELANTGISFMPEGLEKELTPQNLADVMAFVRSEPETDAK